MYPVWGAGTPSTTHNALKGSHIHPHNRLCYYSPHRKRDVAVSTGDTATFGELLRRYRTAAGLTQEELAERARLSARGITALESGERTTPRRDTVQLLADALGLSEEARHAFEAVAKRRPLSAITEQEPRAKPPSHNLPEQLTPFIGRRRELAEIGKLLTHPQLRLLTLTGTAGTGKTRLGLQAAEEVSDGFPDGTYFVPLAPITDPLLVIPTISRILGLVETESSPMQQLKEHLREKRMLLLLDNLEQVLEAAALISELISAAPGLKVLATSRAALRVRCEREYPVQPLPTPRPPLPPLEVISQYDAVRLFIDRAREVRLGFEITSENAPAVVQICHRLDGLPLAIELATARLKILQPQQLLSRLERRLRLLTGGARDLPERQRTLRGALEWSYELLGEAERTLFGRLSVFVGGCTLDTVEAVCDPDRDLGIDVLDGLSSLVDGSLLQQVEVGEQLRFRMLETIREYALERLEERGEAEELRCRHAEYFLVLAEEAEPQLRGPQELDWLDRLEEEHNNLRAALRWSLDRGEAETPLRLAAALGGFWLAHSHLGEGRRWLEHVLQGTETASSLRRTKALYWASATASHQGDYEQARLFAEEGLQLARELCDKRQVARALNVLGTARMESGDLEEAARCYSEAAALMREVGDKPGISMLVNNAGELALRQGDPARAELLFEESLALDREIGDSSGLAYGLTNLGQAALLQGNPDRAEDLLGKGLSVLSKAGDRVLSAGGLEWMGMAAAMSGRPERAARLWGAAEALRESTASTMTPFVRGYYESHVHTVRSQLDPSSFQRAWSEGNAMSLERAVAYALEDTAKS